MEFLLNITFWGTYHLKNHMTPHSLPIFSHAPLIAVIFLDEPPQKITFFQDFTFLIFHNYSPKAKWILVIIKNWIMG